jgi:hypothetical protein
MFRGLDWWVALKDGVFWVPIFVNRDQISWILFVRLIGALPLLLSDKKGRLLGWSWGNMLSL